MLLPLCRDLEKSLAHLARLSGSLSLVHHSACHSEQVEVSSHLPSEGPASVLVSVLYSTLHALRARLASKGNSNHTCLNIFRHSQVHSYALTAHPHAPGTLALFLCPVPKGQRITLTLGSCSSSPQASLYLPSFCLPPCT